MISETKIQEIGTDYLIIESDIGQIPDVLTQDSIYHRSNFILSAPNGIEVSHSIQFSVHHLHYSHRGNRHRTYIQYACRDKSKKLSMYLRDAT